MSKTNQASSTELLTYPFCGSPARLIECCDEGGKLTGWDVGCEGTEVDCIALDGFTNFNSSETLEKAIDGWNRRCNAQVESRRVSDVDSSALFDKCVRRSRNGCTIRCRLGLWCVDAPTVDQAEREARHYWVQYHADGEYDSLLSNNEF